MKKLQKKYLYIFTEGGKQRKEKKKKKSTPTLQDIKEKRKLKRN